MAATSSDENPAAAFALRFFSALRGSGAAPDGWGRVLPEVSCRPEGGGNTMALTAAARATPPRLCREQQRQRSRPEHAPVRGPGSSGSSRANVQQQPQRPIPQQEVLRVFASQRRLSLTFLAQGCPRRRKRGAHDDAPRRTEHGRAKC